MTIRDSSAGVTGRVCGKRRGGNACLGLLSVLSLILLAGCAGGKRPSREILSPEQMYAKGLQQLARRKTLPAVETLKKIDQYDAADREELEPKVRLALADATFYQASDLGLIDARSLYLDFVTLYGDHRLAPYAQFQAGMCSLLQISNASRDQSQTQTAIADLRETIRRYSESHFATAARMMVRTAEARLIEHEYLVGRFYLKRKSYVAAADRFRGILNNHPDYEDQEKVYFHFGQALLKSRNTSEGRIYLDKLVSDFPNGKYASEAKKALANAANGID